MKRQLIIDVANLTALSPSVISVLGLAYSKPEARCCLINTL
jgi:hypothetical protein